MKTIYKIESTIRQMRKYSVKVELDHESPRWAFVAKIHLNEAIIHLKKLDQSNCIPIRIACVIKALANVEHKLNGKAEPYLLLETAYKQLTDIIMERL